jgi:hypothetical protein
MLRRVQPPEQIRRRAVEHRVPKVRGDGGQRLQDESPLRHAGVGNHRIGFSHQAVPVQQDVEVEAPRRSGAMIRGPVRRHLDRLQMPE